MDNTKIGGHDFSIIPFSIEEKDRGVNKKLLKEIAEKTKGVYTEDTLASFQIKRDSFEIIPSREPCFYFILLSLFLIELIYRRRKGLS